MPSFKVPCPSCEHQVSIKNPSLIGTKVECPKCKYRFKVEEPAEGVGADTDKPAKGEKKASDKKKNKKLVGVAVGVLAVVVLVIVGVSVVGGGGKDKGKGVVKGPGQKGPYPGGVNPDDPDKEKDKDKKEDGPGETKKSTLPTSNKQTTNLLPGDTVALYRFDVPGLLRTPAGPLFDAPMLEMFRSSMGFEVKQIEAYYHAFAGPGRDPFGVIRLKDPVAEADITRQMALADKPEKIKGRFLHAFRSNPFIDGVANSVSFSSLFGDLYEKLPASPTPAPASRVIGVCVYDTQHILIGDHARLKQFLAALNDKGYPTFQSDVGTPATGASVAFAENPLYLSLDPKLKRLLKDLGSEVATTPLVLYAEKLDARLYDPKLLKSDFQLLSAVLDPVLNATQYLGANLTAFSTRQLAGTVRVVATSNEAAFNLVKDQLVPGLTALAPVLTTFLKAPVEFRNLTATGTSPPDMTGMNPMSGTFPMTGIPPKTGSFPGPGPMTGMPPTTGMPPIGPFPMTGMPPTTGMPPIGPYPMPGPGPMTGMPPTTGMPETSQQNPSHVDLGLTDQNITVAFDLNWSDEVYRQVVAGRLVGQANTIKGKMAIFTSDLSYHGLAAAVPKMTGATSQFPRGTGDRRLTDSARLGLKYKPETRTSFFVDLLPYMGRNDLHRSIDTGLAWYDEKNLPAAEAWVPELLVPSYPQSAWRATSPYVADGRVLGGTNYVGIAGSGSDAARYDPTNPAFAKKVGIVGYDWGSKVSDVTDGLSNTIYLMQTPPGLSQPWMAGGGATVRGLNEADPMRGFAHTHGTPNGKPGTYVLMGDGSVRFVPANINPKVLLAMSTRAGMEGLADIETEAPRVNPPKKADAELKADPTTEPRKPDEPKKKGSDTPVPPADGPKLETAPAPRAK